MLSWFCILVLESILTNTFLCIFKLHPPVIHLPLTVWQIPKIIFIFHPVFYFTFFRKNIHIWHMSYKVSSRKATLKIPNDLISCFLSCLCFIVMDCFICESRKSLKFLLNVTPDQKEAEFSSLLEKVWFSCSCPCSCIWPLTCLLLFLFVSLPTQKQCASWMLVSLQMVLEACSCKCTAWNILCECRCLPELYAITVCVILSLCVTLE